MIPGLTGVKIEVKPEMMPYDYIGYDRDGRSIFGGIMGGPHLREGDGMIHKIVVGAGVWEALQSVSAPRPMTGFFASLTDEQKAAALAYDGPDC